MIRDEHIRRSNRGLIYATVAFYLGLRLILVGDDIRDAFRGIDTDVFGTDDLQ